MIILFPACAGVIPTNRIMMMRNKTFPRVCGGDPGQEWDIVYLDELFPACAGVILVIEYIPAERHPFPRVCGGDPRSGVTFAGV